MRDLAAFYVTLLEQQQAGVFNGVSTSAMLPAKRFYETVRDTLNPRATLVPVADYELLEKNGLVEIVPWVLLKGNNLHATDVQSSRSAAAGLKARPLVDTLRDTAAWWPTVPAERRQKPKFVITPDIEARVLAAIK